MAFINETHLLANAYYDGCTYSLNMSSMEVDDYAAKCGLIGSEHQGFRSDLRFERPVGLAVSATYVFISLRSEKMIISIDKESGHGFTLVETPQGVLFLSLNVVNTLLYMSLDDSIAGFSLDGTSANVELVVDSSGDGARIDYPMDLIILDGSTLLVTEMREDK